jgi:hypothetical protein
MTTGAFLGMVRVTKLYRRDSRETVFICSFLALIPGRCDATVTQSDNGANRTNMVYNRPLMLFAWRWKMLSKNRYQLWRRMGFGFLLILTLLILAGCSSTEERDFTSLINTPAAVPAELPDGVKMARDAAVTYVTFNYNLQLPMHDADWLVEYDVQQDFIGAGAYRLTADSCILNISNPLPDPDSPIYHVVLDDAAAGFHWEGDVDCQGQVLLPWSSVENSTAFMPKTINIVALTDLYSTVGIEVCRLDCGSYTPLFTIGDPELIASLISTLDSDMPLRPHAQCPAAYQLHFILAEGQHHDFGYTCQMMTPTFLRGNQEFWMGHDAIVPDAFNELMLPLIAPHVFNDVAW